MKQQIKRWDTGEVVAEGNEGETLFDLVTRKVAEKTNLYRASLDGASLDGARLDGARLVGANLACASLVGASLVGASLVGASLVGASLVGARLDGASLDGASLVGASLAGASLVGARLPTKETWEEYLSDVVPALLVAGGKAFTDIACPEHWECHSWDNCPIAAAFSVKTLSEVPLLYQPRAEQFIQFFDAKLIALDVLGRK